MIDDPAWFYSSLAQASAAIVGLVGAVLGSRIIDHIALMRRERRELDQDIGNIRQHFDRRVDHFHALGTYLERERTRDTEAIQRGDASRLTSEEITFTGSRGGSPWRIPDTRQHLEDVERQREELHQVLPAYRRLSGGFRNEEVRVYADRLRQAAGSLVGPDDQPPKSVIYDDARLLAGLSEHIVRFRSRLVPASFVVVFLLLAWIAVTGILWPLSALPGFPNAYPKQWMLRALGAGLLGLIGYFSYQFRELRQLGRLRW